LGSEQITAGLEGEYVGERRAIDGQLVDGYYRQNVTIAARLRARLQASFTIGNLFNKEYRDVGAVEHRQAVITQDGRTARASVTYRF
jgi:outer membrane receptor protein involved in Fe transport